ncbi:MAG: trypsin-like peptidase domain-containing protein [Methylocystis sp.]|uniref:trypsin-like peptidase domain-containing protein n=1 Tax=Methylocystis sp. TaxID=1911079 RepID=UPI0039217088
MTTPIERIVIRHLSGSKANQIEQLPIGDAREFTIGRDPASKIAFDPVGDSVVSRKHALIRIEGEGDKLAFKLSDAGSSNGTFLNGERVTGEVELLPEDTIELGAKGPKFTFDVQPRPASFAARTQVIGVNDTAATRVIKTAEIAASTAVNAAATGAAEAPSGDAAPKKFGVGQETVQRMIGEERRASRGALTATAAGIGAVLVLGGAILLWQQWKGEERVGGRMSEIEKGQEEASAGVEGRVKSITGMTPQEIYDKYKDATAKIYLHWRLYDKMTGKPVYHQTFNVKISKNESATLPAYVRLGPDTVVRWLTLDDEYRSNHPIDEAATGSGFVVSEQGYLLTNKHVAAGWEIPYRTEEQRGVLFDYRGGPDWKRTKGYKGPDLRKYEVIDLRDDAFSDIGDWVPDSGGLIFPSKPAIAVPIGGGNIPDPSKADKRTFEGRNDTLETRFPGSRLNINASLVRASTDSDAALIKIDSPQSLSTVELASDDNVTVGERVVVLGYPAVSVSTFQQLSTQEGGGPVKRHREEIPEATITDGIVSKLSPGVQQREGVTTYSSTGDVIQLSITATGAGNSGGPVFDATGKVIGLFTYSRSRGNERVTLAVPIKYGRDLLRPQRE